MDLTNYFKGLNAELTVVYAFTLVALVLALASIVTYVVIKTVNSTALRARVSSLKVQLKKSKNLDFEIDVLSKGRSDNPYFVVCDSFIATYGSMTIKHVKFDRPSEPKRTTIKELAVFKRKIEWKHLKKTVNKYKDCQIIVSSEVDIEEEQKQFSTITAAVTKEAKLLGLSDTAKARMLKQRTSGIRKIVAQKEKMSSTMQQATYEEKSNSSLMLKQTQSISFRENDFACLASKVNFYFDKAIAIKAHRQKARSAARQAVQAANQTPKTTTQEPVQNSVQATAQQQPDLSVVANPAPQVIKPINDNIVDMGEDLAAQAAADLQNSYEDEGQAQYN